MRRSRHVLRGVLAAAAIAALAPNFVSAKDCSAEVRARLTRDEVREEVRAMTFMVDVDTREDCAKVYVDFTSTERLFDGEEITTTRRGWRKATGSITYKVDYPFAKDSTVVDWKFKVASCVVCGTE